MQPLCICTVLMVMQQLQKFMDIKVVQWHETTLAYQIFVYKNQCFLLSAITNFSKALWATVVQFRSQQNQQPTWWRTLKITSWGSPRCMTSEVQMTFGSEQRTYTCVGGGTLLGISANKLNTTTDIISQSSCYFPWNAQWLKTYPV